MTALKREAGVEDSSSKGPLRVANGSRGTAKTVIPYG